MSKGKDMTYSNKILFTKVGGRVDLGHIGKRIKKVFRKYLESISSGKKLYNISKLVRWS